MASQKDIQAARRLLKAHNFSSSEIPPTLFAITAKRMNKTLAELLKIIATIQTQGQGEGQAPIAETYT